MVAKYQAARILSVLIIGLATAVSVGGLVLAGLYTGPLLIKAALQGNDLVTLVVAVPVMIAAMVVARRGSVRAELTWLAMIGYMLYNFAFYLFGAAFNVFFWLYVALFSLSIWALILSLPRFDAGSLAAAMAARTPVRAIAAWMAFFGLLLGGMWIARSAMFWTTGQVPSDIVQTGHPTGIVYALDMSLLVPTMIVGAVMLWRRQAWGYVIATVMGIKCVTYAVGLQAMSLFANAQTGAPDRLWPFYAFLGIGSLVAMIALMANMPRTLTPSTPG